MFRYNSKFSEEIQNFPKKIKIFLKIKRNNLANSYSVESSFEAVFLRTTLDILIKNCILKNKTVLDNTLKCTEKNKHSIN